VLFDCRHPQWGPIDAWRTNCRACHQPAQFTAQRTIPRSAETRSHVFFLFFFLWLVNAVVRP